jgi:hypothetical protein
VTRAFVGVVAGSLQKMFRFGVGHDVRYPRDIEQFVKVLVSYPEDAAHITRHATIREDVTVVI